jgi:hypothetical protein
VTARMVQAVRDLVAADKAWHGVSAQVTQLLARVPNASVRYGAAGDHGYADAVREARRAAQREVRSPLPHWTGVRQDEDEQRVALLGRLKRLRRPTPAQQTRSSSCATNSPRRQPQREARARCASV